MTVTRNAANTEGYRLLGQEYFTLRLVRLKSSEEWLSGDGIFFLFPKGGAGKYSAGSSVQRLAPGDVLVLNGSDGRGKLTVGSGAEIVFWCFSLRLEHLYPLFAGQEISLLEAVADELKSARFFSAGTPLAKQCHRWIEELPPEFNLDHRSQLLRIAAAALSEEFKLARQKRIGVQGVEEHLIQVFENLSADELVGIPRSGIPRVNVTYSWPRLNGQKPVLQRAHAYYPSQTGPAAPDCA